jgi:hypothetical protein
MDQERLSRPAHWPSVPELRVLITLGPETMERSKDFGLRSSTSPSAMTSRTLCPILFASLYSIRFPLFYSLTPFICIVSIHHSTLDPGREAKARPIRIIVWIDSALAPGEASPRLSLIYSHILPHSRLVCQRAIVLPTRTRAHSPVSLSPRIASPFMPHSYALYPMTHPFVMTHHLCSLYAIGPCPLVTCDMT